MRALSEAMVSRIGSNAFGQAITEGLERSPDVVDQPRTTTHEHLAGTQKRQVRPGFLAAVLQRVQKLGIHPRQPGQILRVQLVGFAFVGVDEMELPGVCDQDLMSALFEKTAHPRRVGSHLDGDRKRLLRIEPAPHGLRGGAQSALLDDLTALVVQQAEIAVLVPEV